MTMVSIVDGLHAPRFVHAVAGAAGVQIPSWSIPILIHGWVTCCWCHHCGHMTLRGKNGLNISEISMARGYRCFHSKAIFPYETIKDVHVHWISLNAGCHPFADAFLEHFSVQPSLLGDQYTESPVLSIIRSIVNDVFFTWNESGVLDFFFTTSRCMGGKISIIEFQNQWLRALQRWLTPCNVAPPLRYSDYNANGYY